MTECSRRAASVSFDYPSEAIDRVVALEKRSYEPAKATHFKPLAALEVVASFIEGVASIEFDHTGLAPFAVMHMVIALTDFRTPLSNAEAELFYSIYLRSKTEDATIDGCRKDFEERWQRLQQSTINPPFDSILQRLVDLGLVEQSSEALSLRERVFIKGTPPLFA
jgi:hypothetical protein